MSSIISGIDYPRTYFMVDLIGGDLKTKAKWERIYAQKSVEEKYFFYPTIIDFLSRVIKKWVLPWKAKYLKVEAIKNCQ